MALQSSIEGFTYRKSFVLPIIDPKLNPMFKELIAFRWRPKLQKVHSVFFISNTVNSQPVSDFRFSIVVACDCCLVSKKSSLLLLIFQENNGFSKKK